jgi:hypothetical protein
VHSAAMRALRGRDYPNIALVENRPIIKREAPIVVQ